MIDKYKEISSKYYFVEFGTLVEVPEGWLDLVDTMCEEIRDVINPDSLDYEIIQIKEKYGQLRVYDFGGNEETEKIIDKYEKKSFGVCCRCGKPATKISRGYICPWCDSCAAEIGGLFTEL